MHHARKIQAVGSLSCPFPLSEYFACTNADLRSTEIDTSDFWCIAFVSITLAPVGLTIRISLFYVRMRGPPSTSHQVVCRHLL